MSKNCHLFAFKKVWRRKKKSNWKKYKEVKEVKEKMVLGIDVRLLKLTSLIEGELQVQTKSDTLPQEYHHSENLEEQTNFPLSRICCSYWGDSWKISTFASFFSDLKWNPEEMWLDSRSKICCDWNERHRFNWTNKKERREPTGNSGTVFKLLFCASLWDNIKSETKQKWFQNKYVKSFKFEKDEGRLVIIFKERSLWGCENRNF